VSILSNTASAQAHWLTEVTKLGERDSDQGNAGGTEKFATCCGKEDCLIESFQVLEEHIMIAYNCERF
jgi:hypothetical protein